MAGMTDSLRILITANGAQAEREFAKVGAAAKRDLGKAETSAQQMSRKMTSAGVAMATAGGLMLIGLGKAAQAAEEEHAALLRLENSIQNMPELAGATTDAFLAQAAALQDSTRFADDATVSAQAMLATFHLTEEQILDLIPAVQDYAAKFGVDLVTASKQVGRAVSGSAGALQRNGIIMDEAAFAADHYGTVLKALRENAGGFAAQEGQTLSGQIEILKNNMMDLVEGVGVGATEAFSDMAGAVKFLSDRFDDLDPAVQSTIGQVATWGAVGLTAAGAVSFLAGQVMKLAPAFQAIAGVGPRVYAAVANLIVPTDALAVSMNGLAASETAAATGMGAVAAPVALTVGGIVAFGAGLSVVIEKLGELAGFDWPSGLSTNVHEWNGEVDRAIAANPDLVHALTTGKQGFDIMNDGIAQATTNLDDLTQEIQDYLDGVYSLPEAQRALTDSFTDLFGTLLTEGHTVDDVAESMQGIVEATAGVISAGGDADQVARQSILTLRDQYNQGLINQQDYRDQRQAILNIPGVSRTLFQTPGAPESIGNARTMDAAVRKILPSHDTHVTASGASQAIGDAWGLKQALDNIPKTVTIQYKHVGSVIPRGGYASGTESAPPGLAWVGERGPELMSFAGGERVYTASQSRAISAGASSGGGQVVNLNVTVNGTATKADGQAVVDALQRWQRSNGRVPVKTMA